MRGKLRDKRAAARRDAFKREVFERKRSTRRDNRGEFWLHRQLEEEGYDLEIETNSTDTLSQPTQKQ